MTNGDVIRKRLSEMTDEELCFICDDFICRLIPKSICNKYAELGASCAVCKSEWESWLQQPAESEDDSNNVDIKSEPVRHGNWEDCSNGWMCSECTVDSEKDYNFCPNCGARMDGGIENG